MSRCTDTDERKDHYGHGTHVAGLVGSAYFGVAKSCNIISVKVANVTGQIDIPNFARAVDWIVGDHDLRKWIPGWNGTIINMSLGVKSARMEIKAAIRRADLAGIVVVNAAGNGGLTVEKSDLWPANSYRAITVAASLKTTSGCAAPTMAKRSILWHLEAASNLSG